MKKPILDITVLLPVYNERESLAPLFQEIKKSLDPLGKTYEVLFVDDGSTDGSLDVLRELQREFPEVRVVEFDKNYGQSAAFGAGFRESRGEVVVTLDADGQNDPADIPRLLELLDEKGVDAVCGFRAKRNDSWVKLSTSRFANAVRNLISQDSVTDTGCSLKVFKRECLADFFYFNGMHRFFPTLVRMHGFNVIEAPVHHRPRSKGVSKYSTWNRLLHPFLDLLAVRWMKDKRVRYHVRLRHEGEDV